MLTVLIGSYARGTATAGSDVDILRVGHKSSSQIATSIPGDHYISYIDYSLDDFKRLHEMGSLFLQHAFLEGLILDGETSTWIEYKKSFVVKTEFTQEIKECKDLICYLTSAEENCRASTAFLFHLFRAVKNLSIFTLAQNRCYQFDKRAAIALCFTDIPTTILDAMLASETLFERGGAYAREQARPVTAEDAKAAAKFIKSRSI
jgi:predicted nucleotidyltransferase